MRLNLNPHDSFHCQFVRIVEWTRNDSRQAFHCTDMLLLVYHFPCIAENTWKRWINSYPVRFFLNTLNKTLNEMCHSYQPETVASVSTSQCTCYKSSQIIKVVIDPKMFVKCSAGVVDSLFSKYTVNELLFSFICFLIYVLYIQLPVMGGKK